MASIQRSLPSNFNNLFLREIKSDLEELSQQSQQQYEELGKAIAHIPYPQAVQNKFWQILQSKAQDRPNWLQFLTAVEMGTRKLIPLNFGFSLSLQPNLRRTYTSTYCHPERNAV